MPRLANRLCGLAALPSARPLTHVLLDSPGARRSLERLVAARPPDLVLAYCSSMARFALESPLDRFPFVLDLVDVDSEKWRDLAGRTRGPMSWIYAREARTLSAFERRAALAARSTLVVNERERTALRAIAPEARIEVVENGVDLDRFRPPGQAATRHRAVFMGVLDYPPNEHAARWLVEAVWPRVRAVRPGASLLLLGASPTRRLLAAARGSPGVEVTGRVPDVAPHLWRSAVALAPLFTARGVQNKVLESIAAGLPVVVSPAVLEGLPDEVRGACRVASDAEGVASAILDLFTLSGAERRLVAESAALSGLNWAARLSGLPALLDSALGPTSRISQGAPS